MSTLRFRHFRLSILLIMRKVSVIFLVLHCLCFTHVWHSILHYCPLVIVMDVLFLSLCNDVVPPLPFTLPDMFLVVFWARFFSVLFSLFFRLTELSLTLFFLRCYFFVVFLLVLVLCL